MKKKTLGTLYIVAAPSGGGKSSLVAQLLDTMKNVELSISHTTRDKRQGEIDGQHYFFADDELFKQMIQNDEFIEYAQVFSRYYGTSKQQIEERLEQGIDVVLDIDWQGAIQLRRLYEHVVSIFIIPPSLTVLRQRLDNRGRDNDSVIDSRMQQACAEISHFMEFDYLVVNDEFSQALKDLQTIIAARRLTVDVQHKNCAVLLSLLLGNK